MSHCGAKFECLIFLAVFSVPNTFQGWEEGAEWITKRLVFSNWGKLDFVLAAPLNKCWRCLQSQAHSVVRLRALQCFGHFLPNAVTCLQFVSPRLISWPPPISKFPTRRRFPRQTASQRVEQLLAGIAFRHGSMSLTSGFCHLHEASRNRREPCFCWLSGASRVLSNSIQNFRWQFLSLGCKKFITLFYLFEIPTAPNEHIVGGLISNHNNN